MTRFLVVLFCLSFIACQSPSELESLNGCDASVPNNSITKTDFKENFKLKLPDNWKINHYYSPATSELYAADTTKQLTQSYILEFVHNDGNIVMGDDLKSKVNAFNQTNRYSLIDESSLTFKDYPAHFFTSRGKKNNNDVLIFNLYVQISKQRFLNAKSEIYGNENIQGRLCESLAIFNTIEFIK